MRNVIQDITHLIDTNLPLEYLAQTFCLQFINPYGNTVFNSRQIMALITELEELERLCPFLKDKKIHRDNN